jgi:hypothetical protein
MHLSLDGQQEIVEIKIDGFFLSIPSCGITDIMPNNIATWHY